MKTSILLALCLCASVAIPSARAAQVTVTWEANPEPEVTAYEVVWGPSTNYTHSLQTTNTTTVVISGLPLGTNYFAVRAIADLTSIEQGFLAGDYCEPVPWKVKPGRPAHIRLSLQSASDPLGPWTDSTNTLSVAIEMTEPMAFYRGSIAVGRDSVEP